MDLIGIYGWDVFLTGPIILIIRMLYSAAGMTLVEAALRIWEITACGHCSWHLGLIHRQSVLKDMGLRRAS